MRARLSLPRLHLPVSLRTRRGLRRWLPWLALLVGVGVVGAEVPRVVLGNNRHWVIPGEILRTAQLSESSMRGTIDRFGIRTVVNLRGCSYPMDWYRTETRVTHAADVSQEDVTLSAYRFPPPSEIRRLIEVLDGSQQPILLHCRRGADRTGLAAAIALLLRDGHTLADARAQLSLRYGHFRFMNAARMDDFLDFYEADLRQRQAAHSPAEFREWVQHRYRPGPGSAQLELIGLSPRYPAGKPIALTLRATNRSQTAWQLLPGTHSGIDARFMLVDAAGKVVLDERAGQFRKAVAPGESVDLLVGLPPIRTPGRYTLMCDLTLSQAVSFTQLGSEPIYQALQIGD